MYYTIKNILHNQKHTIFRPERLNFFEDLDITKNTIVQG